ncbi:MAG: tRNA(Ile)-lysidine synthase [Alphaproteobacteria bacterium]|nr:tRNA(Ile)-lysidine synthase [Alphaproteobacteria bacterium]
MSAANRAGDARPVSTAEFESLFAGLVSAPAIILAVSGGPDSTALLFLAARWRAKRKLGPKLLAVTIDHGLRAESAREAKQVARLARKLGVVHRTLRWTGKKPTTGIQEKARQARYGLLADAASKAGASHVLTAHTLDDQAETVLMRLIRGSGMTGLGGMAKDTRLGEISLLRPFLRVPKARLLATLKAAKIPFIDDPSNANPRFTRIRMRALMPALAGEGLSAERLALLGRRMRRGDAALELAAEVAAEMLSSAPWSDAGPISLNAGGFGLLPSEIALRLLGHAVTSRGDEGPVELAKLELLHAALASQKPGAVRFRRTLAGALVTLTQDRLVVERAPRRRGGSAALTTRLRGRK